MKPCIIIPVYNHEHAIVHVIAHLKPLGIPCLLINDGSSAACTAVLEDLAQQESAWLTLINRAENSGKGAAVLDGFNKAIQLGYTHALQIDADGQHNVDDIPRFLEAARLNPNAMILGKPIFDNSVPKSRLYGRRVTNFWIAINTLSLAIADGMCGFRLYPLPAVAQLMATHQIGQRMDFDIDSVVRLYWQGVKAINIPTTVNYPIDGVSHFKLWNDNIMISKAHARLFFGMLIRIPQLLKANYKKRFYFNLIQFFSNNSLVQFTLILAMAGFSVFAFGYLLKSYELSLRLLVDPSSLPDLDSTQKMIIGIVQVIVGLFLTSAVTSVLTNQLSGFLENQRLKNKHNIIKEAFETQSLSVVRVLIKKEKIKARLRYLNVENAEARLEIGKEDIIKAIGKYGKNTLRLRYIRTSKQLVIEDFNANTSYGAFVDNGSPITIIATQNYSDASIGHFSETLAQTLCCNYISNEFFSGASPLKSSHIVFSARDEYINIKDFKNDEKTAEPELKQFIDDINKINTKTKLYIYINSGSDSKKNDFHLLFRGNKDEPFKSENATYSNLDFLKTVCDALHTDFIKLKLEYKVGTHEEMLFDGERKLANAIHKNFNKDVLVFCISTKILWLDDEFEYYKTIVPIISAIKMLEDNLSST